MLCEFKDLNSPTVLSFLFKQLQSNNTVNWANTYELKWKVVINDDDNNNNNSNNN